MSDLPPSPGQIGRQIENTAENWGNFSNRCPALIHHKIGYSLSEIGCRLLKMVIIIKHVCGCHENNTSNDFAAKRGHTLDGSCENQKPNVGAAWDQALVSVRISWMLSVEPAPGSDLSGNPDFLRHKSIKRSGRNPSVHLSKKCWSVGELGVSWETSLGCLTVSQLVQWDTGGGVLDTVQKSAHLYLLRKIHILMVWRRPI